MERPKRSHNNLHEGQNNGHLMNGFSENTPIMDSAGALTENSAMLLGG